METTLDIDLSREVPTFDEALARVQAAPCHQGDSLEIQKWWAEGEVDAAKLRAAIARSLRLRHREMLQTAPEGQ